MKKPDPTHIEIHSGVLKCECGCETFLADKLVCGGTLFGTLVANPENQCPQCKRVWFCPSTADCEELVDRPRLKSDDWVWVIMPDEHPFKGWRMGQVLVKQTLLVDGKAYGFSAVAEWGDRLERTA